MCERLLLLFLEQKSAGTMRLTHQKQLTLFL